MRPSDDSALEWLDESPSRYDAWAIVEEGARLSSLARLNPNDLHLAGKVYGLAIALTVMDRASTRADYGSGYIEPDVSGWIAFMEDFVEEWYEGGRRL